MSAKKILERLRNALSLSLSLSINRQFIDIFNSNMLWTLVPTCWAQCRVDEMIWRWWENLQNEFVKDDIPGKPKDTQESLYNCICTQVNLVDKRITCTLVISFLISGFPFWLHLKFSTHVFLCGQKKKKKKKKEVCKSRWQARLAYSQIWNGWIATSIMLMYRGCCCLITLGNSMGLIHTQNLWVSRITGSSLKKGQWK
jgi:hypothetical protein